MVNRGNLASLSRIIRKGKFSSLLGWATSLSRPLLPATWKQPDVRLFAPILQVSDCEFTSPSFVLPTFNMKTNKNSKDNKSGQRSSTASQGKVPSNSFGTSKPQDPDSSIDLIEDELDSYEPPKTRGSKGAKARKQWKSQDFLKSPETRSKTKLKIKQEPISPEKSGESSAARGSLATSSSPATPAQGEYWPNRDISPKKSDSCSLQPENPGMEESSSRGGNGIDLGATSLFSNFNPQSHAISGTTIGSDPGSQMAAKPRPVGIPEDKEVGDPINHLSPIKTVMTANRSRDMSPPPNPPPRSTSTPGRTPSKVKVSTPRRSPRVTRTEASSPGKILLETRVGQFSRMARKKASQTPIAEESDPQVASDEDTVIG